MARERYTQEDRLLEQEIRRSTSVSSRYDDIIDHLYNNKPIQKGQVPNYSGLSDISSESQGISMSYDDMINAVAPIGAEGMSSVLKSVSSVNAPPPSSSKKFALSKNQWRALQKYPALIEFLGTEEARPVIEQIAGQVKEFVAAKVGQNSQEISKFAQACVCDRNNLKQYFVGEDESWACVITASGPFRGDEALVFKREYDQAYVVRKTGDDYVNVTDKFNVVHDYAEK